MANRVLVLDDDSLIRTVVRERLTRRGYVVSEATTVAGARAIIDRTPPDAALLDIRLPDGEGTEILEELGPPNDVPCIMITAHATVQSAVEALKHGAEDYLEKPFSLDRLEATLDRALERTRMRREIRALRKEAGIRGDVIGSGPAMREVLDLAERVAAADTATVLLLGETGTGKGVVARLIHRLGARAHRPFVTVTCSALPESLMESELFGHEKGAFTDARTLKRGLVEVADGGTLFLDEIAELSPAVQGKLLRFLEDHVFRRVGGIEDRKVDVRVIAATNRILEDEVEAGRFREDLFYRLRVLPIELPPLRHRRSDIPLLVRAFVVRFAAEFGKEIREVDAEAMELIEGYGWPGNVRELCNVVERAVLLTDDRTVHAGALPAELRAKAEGSAGRAVPALTPAGLDLAQLERRLLGEALEMAEGNRSEAGRLLGLSRHQIRNRLRKFGVDA
ncbi:MAG: sigma-54 dependent transcriptional regulator [Gemmatimonadota bacterium]|nr:sigma-54 dependent transcriptional regulator [Gemmatimonadota bacterium]MDH5757959.1 sigma-54 dependent transcriptional regulator [Gemmatimonadota bacterium]